MTIQEFTTELFCRVDDARTGQQKHSQALLHPSESVTLGLLFALKGVGNRAFYRWAQANLCPLFPRLPGIVDSFGIELIHPRRQGRSERQMGKKGKSNLRWIVGAKLCFVLDHRGRVVDWAVDTANVYDSAFHPLIEEYDRRMLVLGDSGFHIKAAAERRDPENLKVCPRGVWNERMVVETVLSMLTSTCRLKKVGHRTWAGLKTRLAFVLAAFNLCCQWEGLQADQDGFVPLSMLQVAL